MKYIDVTIIPSPEISSNVVLEKVMKQAHLALVEAFDGTKMVGVAFPEYDRRTLGTKVRFIGEEDHLDKLNIKKKLGRLEDYVHITRQRDVPEFSDVVSFKKVRGGKSKQSLVRRAMKRQRLSEADALDMYSDYKQTTSDLPFFATTSETNGTNYYTFVDRVKVSVVNMESDSYGLGASVPHF